MWFTCNEAELQIEIIDRIFLRCLKNNLKNELFFWVTPESVAYALDYNDRP